MHIEKNGRPINKHIRPLTANIGCFLFSYCARYRENGCANVIPFLLQIIIKIQKAVTIRKKISGQEALQNTNRSHSAKDYRQAEVYMQTD